MFECIKFDQVEGRYTLTLSRPDRLNSFNQAMHREMRIALDQVIADQGARVLLIQAEGKGFCAGQDLSDSAVEPGADLSAVIEKFYNPLIQSLAELPIPTVAKVQGVAAGAGANLALACDLVYAGESASFIQAFSSIGLVADSGGTWQLPRLVGLARAMGLTLLGERVSAKEAIEMGMIWGCVPDDRLDLVVGDVVAELAVAPTLGLGKTKHALRQAFQNSLVPHLAMEAKMQGELGSSHDYAEGVLAFAEKRPARFKGY